MRAPTFVLLLALVILPAALPPAAAQEAPDVEVRRCEPPTFGYALYVNGARATYCYDVGEATTAYPEVKYRRCDPPYFGYEIWVNGDQLTYCAHERA